MDDYSQPSEPVPMYYHIYRDSRPDQPFDASAPLVFVPPKDSDELYDALKMAFPHLKTHSERMRDAVLRFLLDERNALAASQGPSTANPSWPAAAPMATPAVKVEDHDSANTLKARPSSEEHPVSHRSKGKAAVTLGKNDLPSQDEMTGVFSLSTNSNPRHHTRRKMTEMEKVEYRKRRIVKACDACAKRKRKCNHMQSEMAQIAASEKAGSPSAQPASHQATQNAQFLQIPSAASRSVSKHPISLTMPGATPNMTIPFESAALTTEVVAALPEVPMIDPMFDVNEWANFPTAFDAQSIAEWSTEGSSSAHSWPETQEYDQNTRSMLEVNAAQRLWAPQTNNLQPEQMSFLFHPPSPDGVYLPDFTTLGIGPATPNGPALGFTEATESGGGDGGDDDMIFDDDDGDPWAVINTPVMQPRSSSSSSWLGRKAPEWMLMPEEHQRWANRDLVQMPYGHNLQLPMLDPIAADGEALSDCDGSFGMLGMGMQFMMFYLMVLRQKSSAKDAAPSVPASPSVPARAGSNPATQEQGWQSRADMVRAIRLALCVVAASGGALMEVTRLLVRKKVIQTGARKTRKTSTTTARQQIMA